MLQFVFALLVLVAGASAEEMLPKFLGVGFPVLLAAVQHFSAPVREPCGVQGAGSRGAEGPCLFALAAGAVEDALCSLPAMTSVSYFLAVGLLTRKIGFSRMLAAVSYPVYQVWLAIWVGALGGGVFNRILLAMPIGLATAFAAGEVLSFFERKSAVYEQG